MKDTPLDKARKEIIERAELFVKRLVFYEIVKALSAEDDRIKKMEDSPQKTLLLKETEKQWTELMTQDLFQDLITEE